MYKHPAKLQPMSPDGDCADECFLCVCVSVKAKSGAFQRETIAIPLLTHHAWRNSSTRPHTTCSPSYPHISLTLTTYWKGIHPLCVLCEFASQYGACVCSEILDSWWIIVLVAEGWTIEVRIFIIYILFRGTFSSCSSISLFYIL